MEVVKAEPINDELSDDETLYQYTIELIQIDKIMISVFNTQTGISYKTYLVKDDEWFKSNIYIFRGDFKHVLPILQDSLINDKDNLPHKDIEEGDTLTITINYKDDMYPFELLIRIPKFVSKHGPIEDRLNSLEYQVKRLKHKLKKQVKENKVGIIDSENEIYNSMGKLIYKGDLVNKKPHGKGIRYCDDSELILYEGEFKDGLYDGQGTLNWFSGGSQSNGGNLSSYYKGTFCKGFKHGLIETYTKGKTKYYSYQSNQYVMGLLHGPRIIYNEDGSTADKCNYENGVNVG